MAIFDIKALSFAYPTDPKQLKLDQVELSIEPGEFFVLCGRSGSGKTTLLRHLKSVLTPHGKREGSVLFDGRPLESIDLREQSSRIGFVMQNPDSQIVTDKVWHELAFGLESLGCDQATMRLRVAEMASYFGIQGWFHRDVAELSGGQKQLLNLASIMAMQPDVLILDEPTSQLDPIAASDFLNTVRKINRELGTTVILTEHRLEDIYYAADRVAVMENGRVIAIGDPRTVSGMLENSGSDMFSALPAPVRVFYGAEGKGKCPLTVREGRAWLDELTRGMNSLPELEDEAVLEECDDPAISVKELWYRYEKDLPDVLRGVSLEVPKGKMLAIVGGNGTGKSTLLRAISGICPPYRGKVMLEGKNAAKFKHGSLFKGMLAMLPQDPQSLFVKKTVREDMMDMLPDRSEASIHRMEAVCEQCAVTGLLDSHPYDLSGGEQQRAALALVLLTEPKVLLLDEPTKGIDSYFKRRLADDLRKLTGQGMTIIMVSHDVEFCAACADLVGLFFDGQLLTVNTPRRFFAKNSFYTTAANRMARHLFPNAVTAENVITLCRRAEGKA